MNFLLKPFHKLAAKERARDALSAIHAGSRQQVPTVVLNDDDAASARHLVDWLLVAIFPTIELRQAVLAGMGQRLLSAPSLGEARQAIQSYCEERDAREHSQLSAELLGHSLRHLELVKQNAKVYSSATRHLPESGFWPIPTDPGNARSLFTEFPYRHRKPLLDKSTPIVSAGSCFAIEIARYLQKLGYNYLITEPQNAADGSYCDPEYSGDAYVNASAAWGIIFNTPSFRQLVEKAFGLRTLPKILFDNGAGSYFDPFREGIRFPSVAAYEANYDRHIAATRDALARAKVLVVTLGLNEVWQFKMDGSVFSRSPARIAPSLVERKILTVQENVDDLQLMLNILRRHNPDVELIVSLSPIGLHVTFQNDCKHVVEANTHSKAVLRVAAEEFVNANDGVHYFPSYELVMSGIERPWEPDQRHVSSTTVEKVMTMFEEMYVRQPS